MPTDTFLLIGKIVGTHGIRGVVKVYSYAQSESIFEPGSPLRLKFKGGRTQDLTVAWAKPHKQILRMALDGIDQMDQAQALVGAQLFIESHRLPKLQEGTYYWFDIIGLDVYCLDGRYLGHIESVIPTGSNDVYVVKRDKREGAGEILIPALESVVKDIDLEAKTMRVDLPEGL